MWLPSLMEKMEHNAGSPCSPPLNQSASHSTNGSEVYVDVFIGAAAQLPANILTIFIMDRVGGKVIVGEITKLVFWFDLKLAVFG